MQFSKTNVQTYNVDLNYIVPETKLLGNESDQRLILKLKSKTWNLLTSNKFKDKLDIRLQNRKLQVISQATLFDLVKDHINSNYEIISIIPSNLTIQLLEPAKKKVPVQIKGNISTKVGYSILGDIKMTPDSITIMGTNDDIKDINSWFTEASLEKDIIKDVNKLVNLEKSTSLNQINITPHQIRIQFEVDQFAEKSFKKKILDNTPDSLYSIPAFALIKISVPLRSLDKIKEDDINVSLKDFKIKDTISNYSLKVAPLPFQCQLLQINPDSVTVYRVLN